MDDKQSKASDLWSPEELTAPVSAKPVETEVGGKKLLIRRLSEQDISDYEAKTLTAKGGISKDRLRDAKRRLLQICLMNEYGEQLLTVSQSKQLANGDGALLNAIYKRCCEANGIGEDDIEALVENSAGN